MYKEKIALKTIEEKACFLQTKKAWRLNLLVRGTGIPTHNKQAHARVVSIVLIISCVKNYQFSNRDSKRNASNILL